jgi:hypothetical protein
MLIFEVNFKAMKRFSLSLSPLLLLCFTLTGQDKATFDSPVNLRNGSDNLPNQVDLIWTPPEGWVPSPVDRWYDYDQGIYGGDAFGSCPGCPVEIAIRWDSLYFDFYDSVYISKIRYVLREAPLDHALRVYQVSENVFDTLLHYPLDENLIYFRFDTLGFDPIPVDISKELWVSLWISDLGPGFPMAVTWIPDVANGYSNLIKIYNQGTWETFLDEFYWDCSWNMGAFLETPNDSVIYPVFNLYRALDDQPFEKIHEGNLYDTIFHNNIQDLEANTVRYFVTCIYEDGESEPSDTLNISLVNTPEIVQKNNIKVFPNPAVNKMTIESGEGKIISVSLINNEGSEVFYKIVDDERITLDISQISSSFYVLKTITTKGIFTSKILILK